MYFSKSETDYFDLVAKIAFDLISQKKVLWGVDFTHIVIKPEELKEVAGRERTSLAYLKNVCSYFTGRHGTKAEVNLNTNEIYLEFNLGSKPMTLEEAKAIIKADMPTTAGRFEHITDPVILRGMVEKLWKLLDDIDSASDGFKPDTTTPYFRYVEKTYRKRFGILESDGYHLYLPGFVKVGAKDEAIAEPS